MKQRKARGGTTEGGSRVSGGGGSGGGRPVEVVTEEGAWPSFAAEWFG